MLQVPGADGLAGTPAGSELSRSQAAGEDCNLAPDGEIDHRQVHGRGHQVLRTAVHGPLRLRLGDNGADTDIGAVPVPVNQLLERIEQTGSGEGQFQAEDAFLHEYVADWGKGGDLGSTEHRDHLAAGKPLAEQRSVDRRGHGACTTRASVSTKKYSPHMTLSSTPSCLASWYVPCLRTPSEASSWATNSGSQSRATVTSAWLW